MAVAQGYGKTVTSGSVFAYDVADTRNSYIGEPTVNIYSTDGFSSWQLDGNHTATRYTGNAPELITITSNYDYHTIVATGNWSSEANRALVWTNSGLLQLSTQYAVSFYARVTSTSTANIGAAFYGNALPNTLTLTNEWQRFTILTSTTATYRPFEFGSKSGAITFQIAGLQYEAKTHTTPYVNGTRSATQGLLPLVGNSTINLSNVSFDSNAQMVFDGTNDTVSIASNTSNNISGNITMEAVIKRDAAVAQVVVHKELQYTLYIAADGSVSYADSSYWSYGNFGFHGTSISSGLYHHIVVTKEGSLVTIYVNGNVVVSQTFGSVITQTNNTLYIGSYDGSSNFFGGIIPVAKIYNRALTAAEVKQNFDFYDARFGIEVDPYYFVVSNRAAKVDRRHWDGSGFYYFKGKNMAATTPAYVLYQKPDASNGIVGSYTELVSDSIGTPARLTVFGPQTSYSSGRYLTSVNAYRSKKGNRLSFTFPSGGTSQYGEEFYKTVVAPYVP